MKPWFNLIEEPWIPCVLPDYRTKELGLLEILARSHEVREIFHPSPLVVTALHRLLLAILHRNFGPENLEAWKELWRRGRWNEAALENYFNRWRDSFFLFHLERPFYQVPKMADAREHPIQKMAEEAAVGNNPVLFDHSFKDNPHPFTFSQASRYLVACQAFALGGGVSRPFNLSHAPLVRGYTVLIQGDNLFETLALNLHIYNSHEPIPWKGPSDLPFWEQEVSPKPDKRGTIPLGYLDYLTFQSRRIHLLSEDGVSVHRCQILQNLKLPEDFFHDPFMCHWQDLERGIRPLKLSPNRAVWRDSHTLFVRTQEIQRKAKKGIISTVRPQIFNWVAMIKDHLDVTRNFHFSVAGLATDQAKVELWRQERLPLPLAYLEDQELLGRLKFALELAEKAHEILMGYLRWVAQLLLAPINNGQSRKADPKEVSRLLKAWAPGRLYWSRLEAPFRRFLADLAEDQEENEEGDLVYGSRCLTEWSRILRDAAWQTFGEVVSGLESSVRSLKAVARVEAPFRARLMKDVVIGGEA